MTTSTKELDRKSVQNRFLPILNWLPSYNRAWLRGDILAGLTVLAILSPSTPAMIGIYQGVIVAILLPFGFFDVNTATAYALLVFGAQLLVWIVLGIWGLKRTDINISKLSQVSIDE